MNVKLLRKVQKHIESEPKRFTFDWANKSRTAPCGTQACIAGWTIILGARLKAPFFDALGDLRIPKSLQGTDGGKYSGPAAKLLKISLPEAQRLFINWPAPFSEKKHSADIAVKRIEHFIRTKGKE